VQAAWAQKLLFLLKNHSESTLESVFKLEETFAGKKEVNLIMLNLNVFVFFR
jgi:hypothetical protein